MLDILDSLFQKFLPGWKTSITAVLIALIGVMPGSAENPDYGGLLAQFGVYLPMYVYTVLYALGLLGIGGKLDAVAKASSSSP